MILIFTANTDGGVVQFCVQMVSELTKMKEACVALLPDGAIVSIHDEIKDKIQFYTKVKSISVHSPGIQEIANKVCSMNPKVIWYMDATILSCQLCSYLKNECKQFLTIHDPAGDHPTNNVGIYDKVKAILLRNIRRNAMKAASKIVLLSKNSKEQFDAINGAYTTKSDILRLGAHVPDVPEEQLEELVNEQGYILFFGRIDKYKGIINLLKAFQQNRSNITRKIVIAGKGTLTEEEKRIITDNTDSILLIQRYINDAEMIWLFKNASCTVLPYIEASQSGVLSISYYFGKPVIVSDLEGLTEFVEDGKTGVVVHSVQELGKALAAVPSRGESMRTAIESYYYNELEWSRNLKRIFS